MKIVDYMHLLVNSEDLIIQQMKPCPLCKKLRVLFTTKDTYRYFCCNSCRLLYLSPVPKVNVLNNYYADKFRYACNLETKSRLERQARKVIKKLLAKKQGSTLLDIGSGYGYLLAAAQNSGLNVFGIEPSKHLFETLNVKFPHKVFHGTFAQFISKKRETGFDFITASHVIEHFPDPFLFLWQVIPMLKSDGILFIETPNLKSHLFNFERDTYTFLTPPEHIYILSFVAIMKYLSSIPYKLIADSSTYSYPEHFMSVLKHILFRRKGKPYVLHNQKQRFHVKSEAESLREIIIDRKIAPYLTPLLNIGGHGSILEVYIEKR